MRSALLPLLLLLASAASADGPRCNRCLLGTHYDRLKALVGRCLPAAHLHLLLLSESRAAAPALQRHFGLFFDFANTDRSRRLRSKEFRAAVQLYLRRNLTKPEAARAAREAAGRGLDRNATAWALYERHLEGLAAFRRRLDTNEDGCVERGEFVTMRCRFLAAEAVVLWRLADTDGNGTVSPAEWRRVARRTAMPEAAMARRWHLWDADADGKVTRREMMAVALHFADVSV